ncbi:MAG: urease accessory protein UreD, partial [Pseudomonadota bacterium]
HLAVKSTPRGSALADLRMSGCMKLLFARGSDRVDAIAINTSGGLTGGDMLRLEMVAEENAALCLTTQAAERAYRAAFGQAQMRSHLRIKKNAQMLWLPQELILFNGASLARQLHCDIAADGRLLLVEPVIFGRREMGETVTDLNFEDRIDLRRAGKPLYMDRIALSGDAVARLARSASGRGASAMATVLYVAPDAEAQVVRLRAMLPAMAGASLLHPDVLVLRILAEDGFALRRALLPMLDHLTQTTLPASWRL